MTIKLSVRWVAVALLMVGARAVFAQTERVVPIAANSPHVFLSLTEERDSDDTSFFSIPNAPPTTEGLPKDGNDHYEVAIFDTGAPATIISHETFTNFDVAGVKRGGLNITELGGVGPSIDAINSDPLGVYAVGFDGLITNPRTGDQTIDRSQLKGSFNDSILYGPSGSAVPNLVGTTTSSHYTTVINYSDPRIIEYEGETFRSPALTMLDLGSAPEPSRRIGLTIVPGALGTVPTFLPDLGNLSLDDLGDNPSTPTIAGSFWLTANVNNNGSSRNQLDAIFDTGAQGSFVSEQIAAEIGFDVSNDKPDFVVRIAGVTGVSEEVPGFYADEFALPGTGGGLTLKNVPLIVFNLTDPRDGVNTLDALIGMNLFTGRDLTLNPEAGNAYLGVSDPSQPLHAWATTEASGLWTTSGNWGEAGVPAVDWYADVRNVSGSPQIARIEEDTRVAQLVMGGTPAGTMTVDVADGKTLTLFGSAIIENGSTLFLNNGTLSPIAVEVRGGAIAGSGIVEGEVLSQGALIPGGPGAIGTLNFPGSLDQLSEGVLHIELGDSSDRANLQFDKVEVGGAMTLDGALELSTTSDYAHPERGESDLFALITAESQVLGEFAEYSFNGVAMEREYRIGADPRAFRDHVGDGQFLSVTYANINSVVVENYSALPGDTNGDGEVQFDDFVAFSSAFATEGDWTMGDFNGNGVVDFPDFLELSANFGTVAASAGNLSTAAVPEPTASVLMLFGAAVLLPRRRRR